MYIIELQNGQNVTRIQDLKNKLKSGSVVKGINTIDSFSFVLMPNNPGFDQISHFTTIVTVFNTNRNRYEFIGRVLYSKADMDSNGLITKEVTCESFLGFLHDSQQYYVEEQNWTVTGLLQQIIDTHNSQVEEYKRFEIGEVTVTDPNDNLYVGIQRESSWKTIEEKLIQNLGGEIRFRIVDGVIYLDYLTEIGEVKTTEIALSKNMKSISRENDPTAYITRLIPLGYKLSKEVTNEEGETETVETEERLDISSVNNGLIYIDDEAAIQHYGIHVGYVEYDDVTDATNLLHKGQAWLKENNRIQIKYSISALDLSLIGRDIDDFDVHNYHPIKNALLGIDDVARIIKKTINVCEEVQSTIEVGDNFKTLSDVQREQTAKLQTAVKSASGFASSLTTLNSKIETTGKQLEESFSTQIRQLEDSISLEVDGSLGSNASIILSVGTNKLSGEFDLSQIRQAFAKDNTSVSISGGLLTFNAGTLIINSTNFTLDANGKIQAKDAVVYGDIITIDGSFKTEMDKGSLRLYYSDVLCGTINTKYWSGAATEGISLRVEEGGNYIMFSHADDTQGSGYVVDYYLNAGWSSNYDEMHIFQTSARFLSDAYFAGKTRIRSLRLFGSDGEYLVGIGSSGQLTVSKL